MSASKDHHLRALHPGSDAHQRPMLALGLRLASTLMSSLLLLGIKLSGEHHLWFPETLVWRQMVPVITLATWLYWRGELFRLRTARPWVHASRALVGTGTMFLSLGVVLLLPLAEATVLAFTAPIFAVILSVVFLREKVGIWRISAILLGLIGVVIMANPGHSHLPPLGIAVGISAAFMVAIISIQLRDLGRTEGPVTIVFYFSLLSLPLLALILPFAPAGYDRPMHHDWLGWLMIGGVGVVGLFSQLLQTASLRYGPVSSVIVMDYAQLGWSLLWGWLVFAHLPPASTWLGAPAIIGAGAIIARREHLRTMRMAVDARSA